MRRRSHGGSRREDPVAGRPARRRSLRRRAWLAGLSAPILLLLLGACGDGAMSDAELSASLAQVTDGPPRDLRGWAQQNWDELGLPGEAEPVEVEERFGRDVDREDAWAGCMVGAGFAPVPSPTRELGIAARDDTRDRALADYTCSVRFAPSEERLAAHDVERLRTLYDWNVLEVGPCLDEHDEPVAHPPSFADFVAGYARTGEEHWTAYDALGDWPYEDVVVEGCPGPFPPDVRLYGE